MMHTSSARIDLLTDYKMCSNAYRCSRGAMQIRFGRPTTLHYEHLIQCHATESNNQTYHCVIFYSIQTRNIGTEINSETLRESCRPTFGCLKGCKRESTQIIGKYSNQHHNVSSMVYCVLDFESTLIQPSTT